MTTNRRLKRANQIVKLYTRGGFLAGLIPLPMLDVAILASIQLKMAHSLAKLYEVEFVDHAGKSAITALIGGAVPASLSLNVASLVKGLPVYGLIAGVMTTSVVGGASTYAVGKVFLHHFESGGTLLNLDPKAMRDYYVEQYKEAEQDARKNFAGTKP